MLHDAPAVHDDDAVGQSKRFRLIMGDIEGGQIQPLLELLEFDPHSFVELGVEIAQRLVKSLMRQNMASSPCLAIRCAAARVRCRGGDAVDEDRGGDKSRPHGVDGGTASASNGLLRPLTTVYHDIPW